MEYFQNALWRYFVEHLEPYREASARSTRD